METYTNETLKDRINHAKAIELAHSPIHDFILDTIVENIRSMKDRYIKYLIDSSHLETIVIPESLMCAKFGKEYLTTEFVGYKIAEYADDPAGAVYSTCYSIRYNREVLIEGTNVIIHIPLLQKADKYDCSNTFKICFKLRRFETRIY